MIGFMPVIEVEEKIPCYKVILIIMSYMIKTHLNRNYLISKSRKNGLERPEHQRFFCYVFKFTPVENKGPITLIIQWY